MKNSAGLQNSERGIWELVFVVAALASIIIAAASWFFQRGYILYYGDAQSHLNLSRSIIDSRTPGYDQLGTVWLPVLHLICLPFVRNNWLWTTGLAGTIPVAICFVVAGAFLFLTARIVYSSSLAAAVVVSCFALNPNILYLGTIPMTELVFLAGLAVLLFALMRYQLTRDKRFAGLAILACWWVSLTRYDGWFLIPFAALLLAFFSRRKKLQVLVWFAALASLAPLYWVAHNWWETGNALNFYNGPYSAAAIQGGKVYPGYKDWAIAVQYYGIAGLLCAGWALVLLGAAGILLGSNIRRFGALPFLSLPPLFYVWSMHSSGGSPIHLPQLSPHSYYNTRYGTAIFVLAAFAAGSIVSAIPQRWRRAAIFIPLFSILPWITRPSRQNWICWKESEQNSIARRAWTRAGAQFFQSHYAAGQGILTPSGSGDLAGILCAARIPLREAIYTGNGPTWFANSLRPDLMHQALWVIAQGNDELARQVSHVPGSPYRLFESIHVAGAPNVEIYRRVDERIERHE